MSTPLKVVAVSAGPSRPSRPLAIGVHASEADSADYRIVSPALQAPVELAAERAAGLFSNQAHALRKIA